jgi:hypothetical protein
MGAFDASHSSWRAIDRARDLTAAFTNTALHASGLRRGFFQWNRFPAVFVVMPNERKKRNEWG